MLLERLHLLLACKIFFANLQLPKARSAARTLVSCFLCRFYKYTVVTRR
jgi:hypothetical protein